MFLLIQQEKVGGGNTTKIHTLVNALVILLEQKQVQDDHIFAPKLIKDLDLLMADGGYDQIKFRPQIEKYKERHLVECFFRN